MLIHRHTLVALSLLAVSTAQGADNAKLRAALAANIDAEAPAAVDLLEKIVNVNSGTFNVAGVQQVGQILAAELEALDFKTRFISMEAVGRAPHLAAERVGKRATKGRRLLLIGHMDTVFEPFSPFRNFVRRGDTATGPGVVDMKGGIVVMLSALKALHTAKVLEDTTIEIFLTSEEELPGAPFDISRGAMIAAAKQADAALCFEAGIRFDDKDWASTARRGFTGWTVQSEGRAGHSSGIFSESAGDGAVYEIARIISRFHGELREPNLTYNIGLLLGGANIQVQAEGVGSTAGKSNIIPQEAKALGEFRALTLEQVTRVKEKMSAIVAASLPGTKSAITFEAGYPPMAPATRNSALLKKYSEASEAMGLGRVYELDPMQRGAGDSAFVSPFVATITGLGAVGGGSHTVSESIDLTLMPVQAKRAALLIYRMTH